MPSRYMCSVLEDMRQQYKTRNFSGMLGSVEQLQVMAYRMEAALDDKRTIEEYDEEASKLRNDLRRKRKEVSQLNVEVGRLKEEQKDLVCKIKKFRDIYNRETKGGTLDSGVCCDRFADNMACDCPKTKSKPPKKDNICPECGVINCGLDCMK